MSGKKIDYLTEDTPIPYQQYVCVSFLSPEGIKNCSLRGLKIRGCFATYDEAAKRAETLHKEDQDFHVFVGEVGKWLPWDPDPNSVKNQEFGDKQLNDLMSRYNKNREKGRKMEQQRKQDMIKKAAMEEKNKKRQAIKNKRNKKKQAHTSKSIQKKEKIQTSIDNEFKERDEIFKKERKKIKETNNVINKKKNEVRDMTNKLHRMQELYNKLTEDEKDEEETEEAEEVEEVEKEE